MTDFNSVFTWLASSGFYNSFLPFFFIFTIVYAFMQKISIFGKEGSATKKYNIIIALAIALLVVIPHVTNSYGARDPITIIMNAVPTVAIWIVAILLLWVLLAAFGLELFSGENGMSGIIQGIVGIVSIVVIGIIFATAAGWAPPNLLAGIGLSDPGVQTVVLIILFTLIVLWFIIGGGGGEPKKKEGDSNILKTLGELGSAISGKPKK